MILIDLHLHSTFSDGSLTPEQLAAQGKNRGISVMSLTDHDTTAGLPSFMAACSRLNVRAVAGVELSADYPSTMHILGYRFDYTHPRLAETLESVRKARDWRNEEMCRNLRKLGFDITLEEVEAEAAGDVVARPHMAKVMVRKGYVQDVGAAFSRYLGNSGPAYAHRERLSPEDCISLIREAGGVAVLAHPVQTAESYAEIRLIAGKLKEWGLWGLECISAKHTAEQIFQYLSIASGLGLFPTAGSDYHGSAVLSSAIGIPVPEDLLPWARLGVTL
ncbi:hypothetical protein C8D99_12626 [Aminivibrio pyruvatiphilus]|jgi:hypothetical protein|uniref:Polymerase/histidinol phosphatase N-terminal domain-containing protein n=1 Tax=Aminivibrio pyruvatiphilus TaxID=1005740 RepID=A0A4R8M4E0_9BACT|nr:PHP domain-containing protein [Aminivibrio pyruvatiphilus]TDY55003.1 hypothetical protein C8D99_12626 [Aminivibrio pyruvatiphilus]